MLLSVCTYTFRSTILLIRMLDHLHIIVNSAAAVAIKGFQSLLRNRCFPRVPRLIVDPFE